MAVFKCKQFTFCRRLFSDKCHCVLSVYVQGLTLSQVCVSGGGPSISHVLAQSCTCFQPSGGIEICKYVQELHVSLIPQIPLLNLSTIWTVCWSHQPLSSPKATSIFSSLDCLPLTRITIVSSSWEHELFFFCALQMKPAPSGSKAEALTAFFLSR